MRRILLIGLLASPDSRSGAPGGAVVGGSCTATLNQSSINAYNSDLKSGILCGSKSADDS